MATYPLHYKQFVVVVLTVGRSQGFRGLDTAPQPRPVVAATRVEGGAVVEGGGGGGGTAFCVKQSNITIFENINSHFR